MKPAIDLTRVHFTHLRGDLLVSGTWLERNLVGVAPEPCLVITRAHNRIGFERSTPCVVPISTAWAWDENIGSPRHCARTSAAFVRQLDLLDSVQSCIRIAALIREHIGDLLSIPPKARENIVVADAIRRDADGREHHSEVIERV